MKTIQRIVAIAVTIATIGVTNVMAQVKVGDNPNTINANSVLEVESNNKGLLLPRVALVAIDDPAPLAGHVAGMQVYNTTDDALNDLAPGIYYNNGSEWQRASNIIQRNISEGSGAPSGSCSNPGEMYTDTSSGSPTEGEVWVCSGGSWIAYIPTITPATTPFYLNNTTIDAAGNKTTAIQRRGPINVSSVSTITGTIWNGTANANAITINPSAYIGIQRSDGTNLLLSKRSPSESGNAFVRFLINGSIIGNISRNSSTSVAYNTTSDKRLKENIKPTAYSLEDLMKISVSDYNYRSDSAKVRETGFIAQDLFKVFPGAVTIGGDDVKENPWQVDYGKLTPLLVKAIQDQQSQIEMQQKEIADLKYTLNERLAQLEQKSLKKQNKVSKRLAKKKSTDVLVYAPQEKL